MALDFHYTKDSERQMNQPRKNRPGRKATLYRMVTKDHVCPFGLKSKDLLEREGWEVDDRWLTTREETGAFTAQPSHARMICRIRHVPAGPCWALLGLQKLKDLESFSNMFLNYDLLAQRKVRYAYVYPFAETWACGCRCGYTC